MSDTSSQAATASKPPVERPPTRDQRLGLARAFQAQALRRPDALAANLGVIAADLMGFAHGLADTVQAGLVNGPASAEERQRFLQDAELYLKFVRQIDRLAQIERHLSPPPGGGEGR